MGECYEATEPERVTARSGSLLFQLVSKKASRAPMWRGESKSPRTFLFAGFLFAAEVAARLAPPIGQLSLATDIFVSGCRPRSNYPLLAASWTTPIKMS